MDASTALMVLLSCAPDAVDCREMRGTQSYQTIGACREALPATLQRLNNEDQHVIGRCTLAADSQIPLSNCHRRDFANAR
jgi:hypothetical protein